MAARSGRTAAEFIQEAVVDYIDERAQAGDYQRAQKAAARIRELQKCVKPDPEGWTIKNYIDYGRP